MSGSAQTIGTWLAIFLSVMMPGTGHSPGANVPKRIEGGQQAQRKATRPAAQQPSEPGKAMRIGGEVSAPKPTTRLNIGWPGDPTQCYQLGAALFKGVVDRHGNVRDVKLIKGPDNEFTRAAREAIARQKFEPATYRGKPVDVIYHVSINHVPVKKMKGPC